MIARAMTPITTLALKSMMHTATHVTTNIPVRNEKLGRSSHLSACWRRCSFSSSDDNSVMGVPFIWLLLYRSLIDVSHVQHAPKALAATIGVCW